MARTVIAIALVIALTVILITLVTRMPSTPHAPTFRTAAETRAFIDADADGYLSGFTESDLHARGYTDVRAYAERAASSARDFTYDERAQLTRLAKVVDDYIRDPPRGSAFARTFSTLSARTRLARLADIPWVFAKTSDGVYEQGMPHTRADTIFLDTNTLTPEVLLHEKIHLFTRAYPEETEDILAEHGFIPIPVASMDPVEGTTRRANPDTNDQAYFSSIHGRVLTGTYANTDPSHVNDIPSPESADHPYEWLAYTASDM